MEDQGRPPAELGYPSLNTWRRASEGICAKTTRGHMFHFTRAWLAERGNQGGLLFLPGSADRPRMTIPAEWEVKASLTPFSCSRASFQSVRPGAFHIRRMTGFFSRERDDGVGGRGQIERQFDDSKENTNVIRAVGELDEESALRMQKRRTQSKRCSMPRRTRSPASFSRNQCAL